MGKQTVSCNSCGSEYVVRDAWAEWDYARQEWVLKSVFDYAYCEHCAGSTTLEWEEHKEVD